MKPDEILPNEVNSVEKDGITIRKGTVGAFTANIKIIENAENGPETRSAAIKDLLSLVPALQKLEFFEFYSIRSGEVRKIIKAEYPEIVLI
jgi:hypothetical protein